LASPVLNATAPEDPEADTPVEIDKPPLVPPKPESTEPINTEPDDASELEPEDTVTFPPTEAPKRPAVISTDPPAPIVAVAEPPEKRTLPPRTELEAPAVMSTLPATEPDPEANWMGPLGPNAGVAEDNSTLPEFSKPTPLVIVKLPETAFDRLGVKTARLPLLISFELPVEISTEPPSALSKPIPPDNVTSPPELPEPPETVTGLPSPPGRTVLPE
jgi:hypothetical protein